MEAACFTLQIDTISFQLFGSLGKVWCEKHSLGRLRKYRFQLDSLKERFTLKTLDSFCDYYKQWEGRGRQGEKEEQEEGKGRTQKGRKIGKGDGKMRKKQKKATMGVLLF